MIRFVFRRNKSHELLVQTPEKTFSIKAKVLSLYGAEEALRGLVRDNGISFLVNCEPESDSFAFETMLHTFYLNTVYRIYPGISTKSDFRKGTAPADYEHTLNSFRNLKILNQIGEAWTLRGIARGCPAVLALPGPSLDLEWLRSISGKALIIAVGRVLPVLLKGGIVPDVVYMQDTSEYFWEYSCGSIAERLSSIAVVNPVAPIYAYHDRFRFVYKSWNYYPFETPAYPRFEEVAPSSASGAYSVARLMGCDPVVFAGCDCGKLVASTQLRGIEAFELPSGTPGFREYSLGDIAPFALRLPEDRIIETQSDYVTAVQWIKSKALRDYAVHGLTTLDKSFSGFLRLNSIIGEVGENLAGVLCESTKFPEVRNSYNYSDYVKFHFEVFNLIKNSVLEDNILPELARTAPFNCLFSGLPSELMDAKPVPVELRHTVLARLDQCLDALG